MDTTAIFSYLNESDHDSNTVIVLSNKLYENVKYICSELSGVQVMYEPLAVNQPEFLELLATLGITIKCSNQELLNNLPTTHNVLIGSGNLSQNFVKSALSRGFQHFVVGSEGDVARVEAAAEDAVPFQLALAADEPANLGNTIKECPLGVPISVTFTGALTGQSDVQDVGSKVHNILEQAQFHGREVREIFMGMVNDVNDIALLKPSILALRETLPLDITLTVELGQQIVESAIIVATKITGKSSHEGNTEYEVDMSMFGELAGYMDDADHTFDIMVEGDHHGGLEGGDAVLSPSRVLGNTGDIDDVIFSGSLEDVSEDGWILLVNAGMTDCREFDIILLDKNYRTLKAVKPMLSQFQSNALESPDLLGPAIRVTA